MAAKSPYKKRRKPRTIGHALKESRIAASLVLFIGMCLMLTCAEGYVAERCGFVTRIQIFPLALAGAFSTLAVWIGVTILFGRIYCSSVCPMGVLQDFFAHFARLTRRMKQRRAYRFEPARNKTRYAILSVVALCTVLGIAVVPSLLDPYSAFGRIGSEMLLPVVQWVKGEPVMVASWVAFGIAAATLVAVGWVSALRGRLICNTVCPVGASLSLFSRYSLFHFDIDTDLCVSCGKCGRVCKSQAINMKDHVVDGSRCVTCFNCIIVCGENAIRYTTRRKKLSVPLMQAVNSGAAAATPAVTGTPSAPDRSTTTPTAPRAEASEPVKIDRRKFLATGLIVAAAPALHAVADKAKRIQAMEREQKPLKPSRYVAPPGRRNMAEFLAKCTGCGLCVARCPGKVLKPSTNEFGFIHALHPVMKFDHAYCRYNCTRCTEVCPTGALRPLTEEEKHIFIIGHAAVEPANCIGCGLCKERCPRRAITMKARLSSQPGPSILLASVDTSLCIGCGACEYICPATPYKAIVVNGIV